MSRQDHYPDPGREKVGVEHGRLRQVKPFELALRFAFGAGVALLAGLVSLAFGPKLGGLFLAFPAIAPATLTLIEKKEGRRFSQADVEGATLGAAGLFAFALVAYQALVALGPIPALLVAVAAWTLVSVGSYALYQGVWRRTLDWARRRATPAA
jgi:hypothetical protein